jgi:predicted CXXCH cytochrome family protein
VAGDTDQGCKDCHVARNVASAAAGSHGVGIAVVPVAGQIQAPLVLPLDGTSNRLQCSTCHEVHDAASADGSLMRLSAPRAVCLDCHTLADTSATPAKHMLTTDGRTLWPGGAYGTTFPAKTAAADQGSCGNCHQTHGWPDAANTAQRYPSLLVDREQNLCYTCHDGTPVVKNVRASFGLGFAHPADTYTGRHSAAEAGTPAAYGTANRHSECTDCHDAHQAKGDAVAPSAPALSNRLRNVGGVQVANGAAGSTPSYTYVASATREYEVCFKCHSSWTTQPAGQSNLAVKLNANNPSFHPVEAAGRNTGINVNSFVAGWTDAKLTYCTDCHTSSDTGVRGPHGSAYRYLLKKPYTASSATRTMTSGEGCFDCHNYDTYANNAASNTVKGYSRFNPPAFSQGHTYHVGSRRYPCWACHDSHGSTLPHLIVTGRNPGLNSYTHTATGGTCAPSCHGTETYDLNY